LLRNTAVNALVSKASNRDFDTAGELRANIRDSPLVRMLESNENQRPPSLVWDQWLSSIPMDESTRASVIDVVCKMRQIHVDGLIQQNESQLELVVFPMTLGIVTDRIHAQQGWFTVPLDPRIDHFKAHSLPNESIKRIVIPKNNKADFLRKLKTANVAGHSVFPGLDGLGKSVGEKIRLDLLG
jgi:hypothetical protein